MLFQKVIAKYISESWRAKKRKYSNPLLFFWYRTANNAQKKPGVFSESRFLQTDSLGSLHCIGIVIVWGEADFLPWCVRFPAHRIEASSKHCQERFENRRISSLEQSPVKFGIWSFNHLLFFSFTMPGKESAFTPDGDERPKWVGVSRGTPPSDQIWNRSWGASFLPTYARGYVLG